MNVTELSTQIVSPGLAEMLTVGVTGDTIETANVRAVDVPQVFVAVTDIVPPDVPADALILVLVELPDQPLGNVHV